MSSLKLIFRHIINCIAFSLQIQSSQTARRIALTLETKSFSQAIFYANTKTPHGEKNCSLPKAKAFSKLFLFGSHSLWIDKKSTRQEELLLVFAKRKAFYTHVSHLLCNYKESTRREELRCSLLKYKFFPSLIGGHKFKDSTQQEDRFLTFTLWKLKTFSKLS